MVGLFVVKKFKKSVKNIEKTHKKSWIKLLISMFYELNIFLSFFLSTSIDKEPIKIASEHYKCSEVFIVGKDMVIYHI